MSNGVVYVLSGTRTAYLIRLGWQFALMILRLFCVRFAFVLRSFCVRFAFVSHGPWSVTDFPLVCGGLLVSEETKNCDTWCMIGHQKDQVLMIFNCQSNDSLGSSATIT
jgi:hypothetical protein